MRRRLKEKHQQRRTGRKKPERVGGRFASRGAVTQQQNQLEKRQEAKDQREWKAVLLLEGRLLNKELTSEMTRSKRQERVGGHFASTK
jgi:hypothetical protein